jgi:hypothetical protein
MKGSYSMQDKYGNASEQVVIRATYDKATLGRMNFDSIYFKNIFDVADMGSVHPAFQY